MKRLLLALQIRKVSPSNILQTTVNLSQALRSPLHPELRTFFTLHFKAHSIQFFHPENLAIGSRSQISSIKTFCITRYLLVVFCSLSSPLPWLRRSTRTSSESPRFLNSTCDAVVAIICNDYLQCIRRKEQCTV